ncbi:diphthine--ammonia ligase family protein [Aspergillus stella-maris]|uniref:diphthine--ammonia ligase family protein n=1 Tax=Aspergillus stella-maris TaxID=1810926 RepID=UPI003CCE4B1D
MSQGSGLNVIALISGGKDSLYSILHCIRNGHNVVALGNLHPPLPASVISNTSTQEGQSQDDAQEAEDDIDSFMYQTIGWNVIPLYESALGIPLYRQGIVGGAVDEGKVYRDTTITKSDFTAGNAEAEAGAVEEGADADETESLIPLLTRIKQAHPEANAICAGAILSTYQRTRIEDVAGRLGLTPLAWLWQYPFLPGPGPAPAPSTSTSLTSDGASEEREAGLLEDMSIVHCSAKIIKVASGALDEGFLWGDVSDARGVLRGKIVRGIKRFGFGGNEDIRAAVLGEGGEYETLAVDGPGFLWKGRIKVEEGGREVRTGEGGVGYLRLKGAKVVQKSEEEVEDGVKPEDVKRPAILDGRFAAALGGLWDGDDEDDTDIEGEATVTSWTPTESIQSINGTTWTVSNITAPEAGPSTTSQTTAIVSKIRTILSAASTPRATSDIIFTTVLLRSMADFPSMNAIYVSLFNKPLPPARATVACGDTLPEGVNVMVSMIVDLGARIQRDGLHVQSRSYWAPANIGPYSQAISVPGREGEKVVYIAGQIPLEPASMELIELGRSSDSGQPEWCETYTLRAVLSLQHMFRIATAMEVDWFLGTVSFFTGTDNVQRRARLAWKVWEKMHTPEQVKGDGDEDEEESGLDVWDIKYGRRGDESMQGLTTSNANPELPNFDLIQADAVSNPENRLPAFLAAQVYELPKGSDIEWQGLGYRCTGLNVTRSSTEFGRVTDTTTHEKLKYTVIEIDDGKDLEQQIQRALEVYASESGPQSGSFHAIIYTSQPHSVPRENFQAQIVPCKSVWGAEGRKLAAGLIIQRQT